MSEQLRISAAEAARKPTGKVVGIIKRSWRPYCGMLNVSQIKEVSLDCSIIPYFIHSFTCISLLCLALPCLLPRSLTVPFLPFLLSQHAIFSPRQTAASLAFASKRVRHPHWRARGSWWPSMAGPNTPDIQTWDFRQSNLWNLDILLWVVTCKFSMQRNQFFSSLLGSLCAQSGKCRREGHRAGGAATGARRPPPGLLSGCAQFPSQDAVGHHTRGKISFSSVF